MQCMESVSGVEGWILCNIVPRTLSDPDGSSSKRIFMCAAEQSVLSWLPKSLLCMRFKAECTVFKFEKKADALASAFLFLK